MSSSNSLFMHVKGHIFTHTQQASLSRCKAVHTKSHIIDRLDWSIAFDWDVKTTNQPAKQTKQMSKPHKLAVRVSNVCFFK